MVEKARVVDDYFTTSYKKSMFQIDIPLLHLLVAAPKLRAVTVAEKCHRWGRRCGPIGLFFMALQGDVIIALKGYHF